MNGRSKARARLAAMRQSLSLSQSYLAGQAAGLGGKRPGVGSVASRREGETEMPSSMIAEQLQGQKGSGPSDTMVEDTDSGMGVSSRRAAAVKRSFAQQVEQFVQRDDVPEEMKLGVREYFERIHEVEVPKQ